MSRELSLEDRNCAEACADEGIGRIIADRKPSTMQQGPMQLWRPPSVVPTAKSTTLLDAVLQGLRNCVFRDPQMRAIGSAHIDWAAVRLRQPRRCRLLNIPFNAKSGQFTAQRRFSSRSYRISDSCKRSLWVARKSVFLTVPSVVLRIPATVLSCKP